ncbi:MAG TPA: RNA methyltransferase [Candidatus Cloacimonadota bacterium]|nr:RNA methyltransferase [Candidatus Cloacimonadota bacterium]HPM00860.1 RNA methyltransferase [Candidatus Cloacimonadota bacterium]
MNNLYLGLVHYPVTNRDGLEIISSITNLDIHDIARSCITFGVKHYFVIHPIQRQQEIFDKVINFWKTDIAKFYNKDRVEALSLIQFKKSIDETIQMIKYQDGSDPLVITTTAALMDNQITFEDFREIRSKENRPVLLLFGTGNGLSKEVHQKADYVLKPIYGPTPYNHLSVRSAVAIVLDRLTTEKYKEE